MSGPESRRGEDNSDNQNENQVSPGLAAGATEASGGVSRGGEAKKVFREKGRLNEAYKIIRGTTQRKPDDQ